MIKRVFVDSSAWYALCDKRDTHHSAAAQVLSQVLADRPGLITSNHVIGESYTLIRSSLGHGPASSFLLSLEQTGHLERLFTPEEIEHEAYTLLKKYSDHSFSFVDAVSFVWMRKLRLSEAFAFDKHFVAAGFSLIAAPNDPIAAASGFLESKPSLRQDMLKEHKD